MPLRPFRERLAQAIVFEALGLAVVIPVYGAIFGGESGAGAHVMIAVSAAVLLGSPLHNWVYDRVEWRRTGRTACRRPGLARIAHALSHEAALTAISVPLFMWIGGHSLTQTLMINLWLTIFYVAYTALYHKAWDTLRPLPTAARTRPDPVSAARPRPVPCAP